MKPLFFVLLASVLLLTYTNAAFSAMCKKGSDAPCTANGECCARVKASGESGTIDVYACAA